MSVKEGADPKADPFAENTIKTAYCISWSLQSVKK